MFINRVNNFSCIHAEMKKLKLVFLFLTLASIPAIATSSPWEAVKGQLMTPWAKDVSPDNAWPEYPRPQMVRETWKNLNGLWDYAIRPVWAPQPNTWDGQILVPFCLESALSGVKKELRAGQHLWYRHSVEVPKEWRGQRILLHFGAVDWQATVWVNGQEVGEHKGGYDPFTFDITGSVKKSGKQEIVVAVLDSTNASMQAVGKQRLAETMRGRIIYTPSSGIWQTVWLEAVPDVSIERLKIVPDVDRQQVLVEVTLRGPGDGYTVELEAYDGERLVGKAAGNADAPLALKIQNPKLWSPDSPFLYDLKVNVLRRRKVLDQVDSYFGMRKISLGKDEQGIMRILLNNKPIFQYGPLDQGYWPDGIYIPATDEGLLFDVDYLKKIGCNMARKHVVVGQDRWYYHCDRLGLLVWQDMVPPRKLGGNVYTPESNAQWEEEQKCMIDFLHNHPSVIMWTVFNESWGQRDTERLTNWTMDYDPTRLVANCSGWNDFRVGHIRDLHDYSFHPSVPLPSIAKERAVVLGEVGGFELLLDGHLWNPDQVMTLQMDPAGDLSREKYLESRQLIERYEQFIKGLRLLIGKHGLCAAVYTQIVDWGEETNGWLTYDRAVSKIDIAQLKAWHESLYRTPPAVKVLLPPSMESPQSWRYTTDKPAENWAVRKFDDSDWNVGNGPFGNGPYSNTSFEWPAVGTQWKTTEIYLRKTVRLDEVPDRVALRVYGLGVFDVYLNGQLVKSASSRDREGQIYVCDILLNQRGGDLLRKGDNVIAVHGSITSPQIRRRRPPPSARFIDVGLVEPID